MLGFLYLLLSSLYLNGSPVVALIPFMLLFILANMLESKSFEVELKDAEPDIIEQLVEFAYTAR